MRGFSLAVAAVTLAGCAAVQNAGMGPAVSAEDVGRLSQDETAPIDAAQHELQVAQQARNQAMLRLQDEQGRLAMARPGVQAADAQVEAARIGIENARKTGDPNPIQQARRQLDLAIAFRKERQARVDYERHAVDLRQAQVTAADRTIALARARVERSKLVALEEAHNPAAGKYNAGLFAAAVDRDRAAADDAARDVTKAHGDAASSFETWQALRRAYAEEQGLAPVRGGAPASPQPAPGALPRSPQQPGPQQNPRQPPSQPSFPAGPQSEGPPPAPGSP